MAHIRYATRGRKDQILEDAHPHTIGGQVFDRGSHKIILGCKMAIVHNGQIDSRYFRDIDKADLKTGCDSEAFLHIFRKMRARGIMETIPGAYTAAIADIKMKHVVIIRDRYGIKPGVLGWKDGRYCFASEDNAITSNGGEFIEDLIPGSIYYLSGTGNYSKEKVCNPAPRFCFFEWNYLASCNSILDGMPVRVLREKLGETLAKEYDPKDAEFVSFLPRCPEPAALAYERMTGKKFLYVFYKMRGKRAFQESTKKQRKDSIEDNLHLLSEIQQDRTLEDKILVCIDDSTVRGNNSKRERELLYDEAKVKKCYHLNYTPPIGIIGKDGVKRGCMFGVDMPPDDNFIARGRTEEEISKVMNMPVRYISLKGMLSAFEDLGILSGNLCYYCIGGPHPFK